MRRERDSYAASDDRQFVVVENGVPDRVVLTARRAAHVDAHDPLTGVVKASADLKVGQKWALPGTPGGLTGFILRGSFEAPR